MDEERDRYRKVNGLFLETKLEKKLKADNELNGL